MNKENLYVIEFTKDYYDICSVEHIAIFNCKVISEEEVNKLLKSGSFVYEHDDRIVVMSKKQYENLCKE